MQISYCVFLFAVVSPNALLAHYNMAAEGCSVWILYVLCICIKYICI